MLSFLLQGIVLGLASGVSPGPMLGLVINQTLRYGWRAGTLVALAPLLTDIPIVLLIVLIDDKLPTSILHYLALFGGGLVIYFGIATVRMTWSEVTIHSKESAVKNSPGRTLLTAAVTNLLNPHPYLFWATAGSTLLLQSFASGGFFSSFAFLAGFYVLLVGSKVILTSLLSQSLDWLSGRVFKILLAGSGILLIGFGILLGWDGLQAVMQK